MIYSFSLAQVALVLGVLYILSHGWAAWRPQHAKTFLLAFPRHPLIGWVLLAAATLWFAGLLATIDLMEYTPHRSKFVLGVLLLGAGCAHYMREFLAVRSLGALLLLSAQVLLDAAFLRDEPARLVITLTAYAYVAAGMALVGAPYLLRDMLQWLGANEPRFRAAALGGAAFGVLLLVLGLWIY
jgi:hypothetical protein